MAYSANFNAIIDGIKAVEGGYVNNPADSGGATNFGIAFNYNKDALAKIGITRPEQMKQMTWSQAKEIYYNVYWKVLWDDLPLAWADIIFNFFINAGANAIRALQLGLVAAGRDIDVDGGYGKLTQQAIFQTDQNKGMGYFRYFMQNFYTTLATRNPSQKVFLNGWIKRITNTGQILTPSNLELARTDAAISKKKYKQFICQQQGADKPQWKCGDP